MVLSVFFIFFILFTSGGCAKRQYTKTMEVTAYCGCSRCCSWKRGSARWLWLDFWHRYYTSAADKGRPYHGLTASGTSPWEPEEGLFSIDSLQRPWLIPLRIILFPWYFLPHDGTIAADTSYYPFGTRMKVSGYGWGRVEDRGSAITGPEKIDLYYNSHSEALQWGRQKVQVTIQPPQ